MARNPKPEPVRRKADASSTSITGGIIEYIEDGVRTGRFAPGQRLIEAEVQLAVGSSRGPVREAMRRLAAEGLIEIPHYKGARVRRLSKEEVEDLYRVREVVEGLAARLAAKNMDEPGSRKALIRLESDFKTSFDGTPHAYMKYNQDFHHLIVAMSESEQLRRLVAQLQIPVIMVRLHTIIDRELIRRSLQQHQKIVKALLGGDPRRAERAMREHVRLTGTHVLRSAEKLFADAGLHQKGHTQTASTWHD
jgi:DNA-binding GntR family transcriptional regulator